MFVIRALPRSGAHLLQTAISSHPRAHCAGEILNPQTGSQLLARLWRGVVPVVEYGYGGRTVPLAEAVPDVVRSRLEEYLVNLERPPPFRPLRGFLLPGHAASTHAIQRWKALHVAAWDILLSRPAWRVLVLRRRDRLRRIVSDMLCRRGLRPYHYRRTSQIPGYVPPLTITAASLRAELDADIAFAMENDLRFAGAHHVAYEDLVDDWVGETARVQSFLGLGARSLVAAVRKGERRPLPEVLGNYDALRQELAASPYADWFAAAAVNDGEGAREAPWR